MVTAPRLIDTRATRVAQLEKLHARWIDELAGPESFPPDYALHLADALDDLQTLIRRLRPAVSLSGPPVSAGVRSVTASPWPPSTMIAIADSPGVLATSTDEAVLWGSIDGSVYVVDATTMARVAGPFTLQDALAYVRAHGVALLFQ